MAVHNNDSSNNSGFSLVYNPGETATKHQLTLGELSLSDLIISPTIISLSDNIFSIGYKDSSYLAIIIDLIQNKEIEYTIDEGFSIVFNDPDDYKLSVLPGDTMRFKAEFDVSYNLLV